MEGKLGKIGSAVFAAALILEGCSPAIHKTPKPASSPDLPTPTLASEDPDVLPAPIDIVNCQANPLDDQLIYQPIKERDFVRIGGITKNGKQDLIDIITNNDNHIVYNAENEGLIHSKKDGFSNYEDNNLLISVRTLRDASEIIAIGYVTCADNFHKTPQT